MTLRKIFLFVLLFALVFCAFAVSAGAAGESQRVYDFENILSDEESIEDNLRAFEENTGVKIRVLTTNDAYFSLSEVGLNSSYDDAVVLEIIKIDGEYYYEFYTYGVAYAEILDSEVNRILDADGVYANLKSGNFNEGISEFVRLTEKAYLGNLQEPMWKTILISLMIASIIGAIPVTCVAVKYKRKQKAPSYPLEKYASVIVDEELSRDSYMTTRVIRTRVSSSSGGGGSRSSGGGGSRGRR